MQSQNASEKRRLIANWLNMTILLFAYAAALVALAAALSSPNHAAINAFGPMLAIAYAIAFSSITLGVAHFARRLANIDPDARLKLAGLIAAAAVWGLTLYAYYSVYLQ